MTIRDRLQQIFGTSHTGNKPNYKAPDTIAGQDALFELYDSLGIVNGYPGTLQDETITENIQDIMNSGLPADQRIFLLQALDVSICNNHIAGMAAPGIEQVSESIREVMYEAGIMIRHKDGE